MLFETKEKMDFSYLITEKFMQKIPIKYKAKNNVYEEFLITQRNDYAIMLSEERSKSQICNFSYIKGCPEIKSKYVKCIISDVIFWQWIMGDTLLPVKICTFQIFILCIRIAFIITNKKKNASCISPWVHKPHQLDRLKTHYPRGFLFLVKLTMSSCFHI